MDVNRSAPCVRNFLAFFSENKEVNWGLMIPGVRPTPNGLMTYILYTLVDKITLISVGHVANEYFI